MKISYRFIVSGRVQGVYFRQSAAALARQLGIVGWIRNRPDGRVEGVASGTDGALDQFRVWLGRGPPAAQVDDVQWTACADILDAGFEIRH
ncbi:MAG: acylphosphatase [Stenotrophobium sp.]